MDKVLTLDGDHSSEGGSSARRIRSLRNTCLCSFWSAGSCGVLSGSTASGQIGRAVFHEVGSQDQRAGLTA
ncbi:hypothetical protein CSUI_005770 [Cystoisospora suis]|uniref:Uncharacterized protein n=1 Tax=Cystoisospora suis TaxID=483139 RepID=A0A2C6KWU0_9APIC|nr:hypothetical protein CSUI_005770 [Cystoisospora suis]